MISKANRLWIIYLISCLLFTFSQFYRSSIAVISPNLVEELNLDTEDLGLISAAFFYAFAAMQIPVGLYLDRVGPRVLMAVFNLVAVVGATVFACGRVRLCSPRLADPQGRYRFSPLLSTASGSFDVFP